MLFRGPKKGREHKHFFWDAPTFFGFIIKGAYWGYPYPNFAYVWFFVGPVNASQQCSTSSKIFIGSLREGGSSGEGP